MSNRWLMLDEAAAYCRVERAEFERWLLAGLVDADGRLPTGEPRFKTATMDALLLGESASCKPHGQECPADDDGDVLLSPREVADRLRLSRSAVYRLLPQIPHVKIGSGRRGGRVFVVTSDLNAWLQSRRNEPGRPERGERQWQRSTQHGARRARSGTRASNTRRRASGSSDPQVAELADWLSSG